MNDGVWSHSSPASGWDWWELCWVLHGPCRWKPFPNPRKRQEPNPSPAPTPPFPRFLELEQQLGRGGWYCCPLLGRGACLRQCLVLSTADSQQGLQEVSGGFTLARTGENKVNKYSSDLNVPSFQWPISLGSHPWGAEQRTQGQRGLLQGLLCLPGECVLVWLQAPCRVP